MCDVTWEPAQNVPSNIIEEFEKGTKARVKDSVTCCGVGQTTHTFSVVLENTSHLPLHRPIMKENEGYACYYVSKP